MMIRRTLARSAEQYVRPRCWHSTTSKAGGSSEKLTNSRRALPEWLEIGKIDVNAACRPSFLRWSPGGDLLQERAVRRELRFEQERHLQDARALREALPDALLFGKGIGRSRGSRHSVGSISGSYEAARASRGLGALHSWTPRNALRPCYLDCPGTLRSQAWWLATTSRWRTTSPLQRRPTIPAFRSRFRKRSEARLVVGIRLRFDPCDRSGTVHQATVPLLPLPQKSSGFARDFCLTSLSTTTRVVILPRGRGGSLATPADLLDFHLRAGFLQLLLRGFGVGLLDAFLDGLRRAVDQVLRFLQAEARQLAHGLDDVDLVFAERGSGRP